MLSPLTKSESASAPPANKVWKLQRTLKRRPTYRVIEENDVRYLWAAYKKGVFSTLVPDANLSPEQFKELVDQRLSASCHFAWALLIDDKPVGFVFAAWSPVWAVLEIVLVAWMPWASRRNIIESAINFITEIKKEYRCMGYALPEHRKLYDVAMKHALVRRVGTSFNVVPGQQVAVYESLHPKTKETT